MTWGLCSVKSGLEGVLLKLRVTSNGEELYTIGFAFITSKNGHLGFSDPGIECTISHPFEIGLSLEKERLEKAKEYPAKVMAIVMLGALQIALDANLECILLLGLKPGEELVKLKVIVVSLSGK